jgi:hypothetical protein
MMKRVAKWRVQQAARGIDRALELSFEGMSPIALFYSCPFIDGDKYSNSFVVRSSHVLWAVGEGEPPHSLKTILWSIEQQSSYFAYVETKSI